MNQAVSNLAERSSKELYKLKDFCREKGVGNGKLYEAEKQVIIAR